jgi:hypothetical protein
MDLQEALELVEGWERIHTEYVRDFMPPILAMEQEPLMMAVRHIIAYVKDNEGLKNIQVKK